MTRSTRRQPNKEEQQRTPGRDQAGYAINRPPTLRSPALESAEQRRIAGLQSTKPRRGRSGANEGLGRPRRPSIRYAADETLAKPVMPRKRLPPLAASKPRRGGSGADEGLGRSRRPSIGDIPSRRGGSGADEGLGRSRRPSIRYATGEITDNDIEQQHTGVTADWRTRDYIQEVHQGESVQRTKKQAVPAITEEEQKKLAELEMRLPRVAGKIDGWLLITVLALLCIGIVMVFSASSFEAAHYQGDASYYFQRELVWMILGIATMLVTMRVDYRQWRRFSLIGMLIILPLLVIVLKFGVNVYGASRWLSLGFFSFEPSELAKLVLALYIADWLARKGNEVRTFLYGLAPFILLVGIVLSLVLLENDLGTAIIIAGFAIGMFFTAGANIAQLLPAMACGGLIFLREAFSSYRYFRLTGFLNPFKDVTGINLQLYQALLALGSGGWFGLGLGASRQKTGYLPFPYTDSIFPIIGEELGFIGCAIIVIFFLFLAFRGFRLARRSPDLYGALLATGITTWLVLQAMINIGANTGTVPYTGVPLPFISFGGSSLVVSLAAVGVLLNISRYIQEPETPATRWINPRSTRQAITLRRKRAGTKYITSSQ